MPEAGDTVILTLQQTRGTPHLWVLLWTSRIGRRIPGRLPHHASRPFGPYLQPRSGRSSVHPAGERRLLPRGDPDHLRAPGACDSRRKRLRAPARRDEGPAGHARRVLRLGANAARVQGDGAPAVRRRWPRSAGDVTKHEEGVRNSARPRATSASSGWRRTGEKRPHTSARIGVPGRLTPFNCVHDVAPLAAFSRGLPARSESHYVGRRA